MTTLSIQNLKGFVSNKQSVAAYVIQPGSIRVTEEIVNRRVDEATTGVRITEE